MDFLGEKPSGGRPPNARQDTNVEQLGDPAFEPDPLDDIAGLEVDNLHTAPRLGIAFLQLVIKLQPCERPLARQRQANDGMTVVKGEPPQKPGAKYVFDA